MIIEKNIQEIEKAMDYFTAEMESHKEGTPEYRAARMACLALSFMRATLKKE